MKKANLIGQRFGRLTVITMAEKPIVVKQRRAYWLCKCDCGKDVIASTHALNLGKVKSCGCLLLDFIRDHKIPNLIGVRFGRLIVSEIHSTGNKVVWKCKCDCGNEVNVPTSRLKNGNTKSCGCLGRSMRQYHKGERSWAWKGGRHQDPKGYVRIYMPEHPNAKGNYVLEHVLVMSELLGRPLKLNESVHHKNGIRNDNSPENLELWAKAHPPGQRISDLVEFSKKILMEYAPELIVSEAR